MSTLWVVGEVSFTTNHLISSGLFEGPRGDGLRSGRVSFQGDGGVDKRSEGQNQKDGCVYRVHQHL